MPVPITFQFSQGEKNHVRLSTVIETRVSNCAFKHREWRFKINT